MAAKPISTKKRPTHKKSGKHGILKVASLGIAGLIAGLLAGCSASINSIALTSYSQVTGNWQFTPSASGSPLPTLAGNLTVNGSQITGTLHPLAVASIGGSINAQAVTPHTACTTSTAGFPVTGNIEEDGKTTLTSSSFSGGTINISGTLPTSQTTLTNATYNITNGACASDNAAVTATEFSPISGTYSGTIYSVTGSSLAVSTVFTQTTQPDANGSYHLQGNSTFGSLQPCLLTPPAVADSTVTGSTLSATYTETPSGGTPITVVVDATFTPDASALTLNSYHITGGYCDSDSGHGILARQ